MLSKISLKELFHKPFQTILLIILIALSIAASVFFVSLNQGIHGGLVKATEPFPQVVGAKGGINQLLLNTVFLQDRPIGNIPQKVLTDLKANKLVNMAIPLGYGDNYRGFRLVGTSTDIFNYSPKKGGEKWMTLKEGRIWDKPFEAVVGSGVVELTDIKIGDTFKTIHGFSEHSSHQHDNLYTVVGILNKVDGPYDQAILTDMRSIWEAHAHHHHHHDHDEHDHEGHDHDHDGGMTLDKAAKNDVNPIYVNDGNNAATTGEVTAILVQPAGYGEAMKLAQEFQSNKEAQLIFPAQNIIQLFSLMGQGEKFWYYVGGFLILTALALVLLTMYLSSLTRMRERAVLQTLGASRGQLLRISLIQNGFIIILGGIIGYALGMLAFATVSSLTRDKTAVFMPVDFYELPIYIAIGTVILGLIVSIIPAYIISKKDTLKYL